MGTEAGVSELICAIDVGSTKIVALIAEIDGEGLLRVIGVGRAPSAGMRRGLVVNAQAAKAAILEAILAAEKSCDQVIERAFVGISGSHLNTVGSKGSATVLHSTRGVSGEDAQRALTQSRNIAQPHNRIIIQAVPRVYCLDDLREIQDPIGMFGYRLEVDASIISGSTSSINNLVQCVQASGVEVEDLVPQPLASAEAVLTPDERQLGVALVDVGGGTTDIAIYLDSAPWHTGVLDIGGDHVIRDVAAGLRMPYDQAETLIRRFGNALPDTIDPDELVQSGAFGQDGRQSVNRRYLAEIINARACEVNDLIMREVKRSGYDGLLPAGVVLTGGVAQLAGFADLSRDELAWPVRIGRPMGVFESISELDNPDCATAVGLLLWGQRRGTTHPTQAPPRVTWSERAAKQIKRWWQLLLPFPS